MKWLNITLLVIVVMNVSSAYAQESSKADSSRNRISPHLKRKNFIGLAPLSSLYFLKGTYERSISKRSSIGTYLKYYHELSWEEITTGIVGEPYYRYYFEHHPQNGNLISSYMQLKGTMGYIRQGFTFLITGSDNTIGPYGYYEYETMPITVLGIGVDIGERLVIGKKNSFFIDFNVGVRVGFSPEIYYNYPKGLNDEGEYLGSKSIWGSDGGGLISAQYLPGQPTSIISSTLSFGFSL